MPRNSWKTLGIQVKHWENRKNIGNSGETQGKQ